MLLFVLAVVQTVGSVPPRELQMSLFAFFDSGDDGIGDVVDVAETVDFDMEALAFVVRGDGESFGLVFFEAVFDGLLVVVATSRDLGTFEHASDEFFARDVEADHAGEFASMFCEEFLEGFGLSDVAREAVEENALCIFGNGLVDHFDDDVVAHETAGVHDVFDAFSEFGLVDNFFAQQVAGRNVVEIVFLNEQVALGTFACTRSAEKDYVKHDLRV